MPEKQDMIHLSALPVFEYRGQIVTNSRDVAALIGKPHFMIMRTIRTMETHFSQCNFASADFFIKATYTDEQGGGNHGQRPRPRRRADGVNAH